MSFCEPARVVTVTSLTPHMRRISIEAEGDWHWPTGGQGDERIDLAFPKPGETEAEYDYFNNPDYGKADLGTEPPWRHYTVRKVHDRILGELNLPGFALRFSEFPTPLNLEAPFLGEHNTELLSQHLGYSSEQIEELERRGILRREPR